MSHTFTTADLDRLGYKHDPCKSCGYGIPSDSATCINPQCRLFLKPANTAPDIPQGTTTAKAVSTDQDNTKTTGKAVSARSRKSAVELLNKTERRFYQQLLRADLPESAVLIQPTLIFPDGDRYRPDLMDVSGPMPTAYEVKGAYSLRFAWAEQGVERFKRARTTWPFIRFRMMKWDGKAFNEINREK